MLKGAMGALICRRKQQQSAFGTVTRTAKAPGTRGLQQTENRGHPMHGAAMQAKDDRSRC